VIVLKRSIVSFPTAITPEIDDDDEAAAATVVEVAVVVVVVVGVNVLVGSVGGRGGLYRVQHKISPTSPASPYFRGVS
jgi:hypothetical protein